MAFVKRKRIRGGDYYYLAESYRDGENVKTRTLAYLGKTPEVPARLAHLVGRSRRRAAVRGLPAAGQAGGVGRQPQPLLWNPAALGAAIARAVLRGPGGRSARASR